MAGCSAELIDAEVAWLEVAVRRAFRQEPAPPGHERIEEKAPALLQQPGARRTTTEE